MTTSGADPYPLPFCPDCGHVHPSHDVNSGVKDPAWGYLLPLWATGPVNWRVFPAFRCGCRIVWEAREKGLIDEACGGKTWREKGLPTTAAEIVHKHGWRWRAEVKALRDQQSQEACGGRGPGPWTVERLVDARLRRAAEELGAEIRRRLWARSSEETAALDAKIEANRKWYEGRKW